VQSPAMNDASITHSGNLTLWPLGPCVFIGHWPFFNLRRQKCI
jgi:hypothetical protein